MDNAVINEAIKACLTEFYSRISEAARRAAEAFIENAGAASAKECLSRWMSSS